MSYNYTPDKHGLSYGNIGLSGDHLEFLDVTLDELKEYLESLPQTLDDKLKLFKAGTHVLHTPTQEIYDKLIVELEKRGYKWRSPVSPKVSHTYWYYYCSDTLVCCGFCGDNVVSYDRLGGSTNEGRNVLEITLGDFRMGNAHRVSDSKQEEHMKITIETDEHHKTTAECNGITAESLCNPMDNFKLPKGVHMAVQRLLDKLERPDEDTCFHVGDTVEVVGCHNKFLKDIVGKRGVVTRIDERTSEKYEIKYEENISGDNRWWSRPEELKLISKEDTGFHVGDIVEVVANESNFEGNPIGLQGVVECSMTGGANVKLPIRDDSLTFYNRELKLIRRGNN